MNSIRVTVLVVILITISGCGGIQDSNQPPKVTESNSASDRQTTPPTTSVDSNPVVLRAGSLPLNEDVVYLRTNELLGTEPSSTTVSRFSRNQSVRSSCYQPQFFEQMDAPCEYNGKYPPVTGRVSQTSSGVTIQTADNASASEIESVLAHEFVHSIQSKQGISYNSLSGPKTTDGAAVRRALIEGQAEYVERKYESEYLGKPDRDAYRQYQNHRGYHQAGVYYFGLEYFEAHSESTRSTWKIFEKSPNTTEQIIHGYRAGEHPPVNLNVKLESNRSQQYTKSDTLGELATRNLLKSRLSEKEAATGAEGWGNDKLYEIDDDDGSKEYIWVSRWDHAEQAEEFSNILEQYLEKIADDGSVRNYKAGNTTYYVKSPRPDTVVLIVGSEDGEYQVDTSTEDTVHIEID